jgi:uncharacterized membrane protein YczE
MIKANVGTAPWDALYVATSRITGLTVGTCIFIIGGIVILINALIRWGKPRIGSMIPIVIIGAFVDFLNLNLLSFIKLNNLFIQWPLFFLGLVVMTFGIALYLQAKLPSVPNDGLMLAITKRTGWGLNITKTISEGSAFVMAFFLSGPIGIGSVVEVIFVGFLVNFFVQSLKKVSILNIVNDPDKEIDKGLTRKKDVIQSTSHKKDSIKDSAASRKDSIKHSVANKKKLSMNNTITPKGNIE